MELQRYNNKGSISGYTPLQINIILFNSIIICMSKQYTVGTYHCKKTKCDRSVKAFYLFIYLAKTLSLDIFLSNWPVLFMYVFSAYVVLFLPFFAAN